MHLENKLKILNINIFLINFQTFLEISKYFLEISNILENLSITTATRHYISTC
jgi:hypothetical protein